MSKEIQLGIRIGLDGAAAESNIERIEAKTVKMAGSIEQAGRAMATEFEAGATAATKSAGAVSNLGETEAAATERIRAMVAASLSQAAAIAESTAAADQSSVSIRRSADENINLSRSLAAVNAQMASGRPAAQSGGGTATEESQKYVASLQRQFDQLGKNAAELAQYEAKMLGGTHATQAQAYAIVQNTEALRQQIAAEERNGQAADAFIAKLKEQTATLGMSRTQLLEYKAAQLGVSEAAAPMIAKLAETGAGAKTAGGHMEGFSFKTAAAKRELLVLAHELSQGQYSRFGGSMMVLGEQTGAAGLLFSSAGLAALGLAAAVGGVAYAMFKGASEQKHMNDALVMTGNYAGLTSDSLNDLAHAAVVTGGSIGEAKKVATELAASGKFTGTQIAYITEATVAWEHATGRSAKAIIKEFESLAVQTTGNNMRATEAISRAAIKLDDTYHFLTESIYEQIRALEKEGDAKGASALVTEEFARVTKERAEESIHNLGALARAWNSIKETIGGAVDAAGDWGKRSTAAIEVKRITTELAELKQKKDDMNALNGGSLGGMRERTIDAKIALGVAALAKAQAALNVENAAATAKSNQSFAQSEAIHAASRIAADDVRLQKRGLTELQVALDQYAEDRRKIATVNKNSPLLEEGAVAAHIAAIKKAHTEKTRTTVDHTDDIQLTDRLKRIDNAAAAEKANYANLAKLNDMYHQAGEVSDQQYYANKRKYTESSAQAVVKGYDDQIAALVAHDNKTTQEEAKTQQKINEILDRRKAAKAANSAQSHQLDEEERLRNKAIVSASDDAVNKYLASLEQEAKKIEEANIGREVSRGAIERETVANLDLAIAYQQQFMAQQNASNATDAELEQAPKILKYLQDQRALRERMANGLDQRDAEKAMKRSAEFAIQDWKNAGASISDSLTKAFGNGGKAIGGMFKAYADNASRQLQLDKQLAESTKGMAANDPERIKAVDRANRESAQAQLNSYANMADAAQGYFSENSRGYAAMGAAAKVMHTAEVALSLVKGINAVLTQGSGDPYSAFARMAAMTAIVAGLGVAISGGGGSASQSMAKDRQSSAGTGTVLGDAAAKSESIANSLSIIEKNSDIELSHTAGMLSALRNIESSIGNLGSLLARTNGLDTSFSNIQTGTKVAGGALGTATAGIAGGVGGAAAGAYYGMAAGSAIGGPIGLAVGAVIGTVVGAIASKLTNVKTNIVDSGISIGSQSLGSTVTNGIKGNTYADVNVKKSFLGIGYSNKTTEVTGALSAEIAQQFTGVISSLRTGIVAAVDLLGAGGEEFIKGLDAFNVAIPNLSLKGLTGEEIQKQLESTFSNLGDQLAKSALPGLDKFVKVGEGYFETLTRVASDYANVDSILASVSKTFGAVGIDSIAARERLIDFSGGVQALAQQTADFSKNYQTSAERLVPVQKYVTTEMEKMGLAGVTSRLQFRDVALGLDLTSEAGARQYAVMMSLQDEFAQLYPAIEETTKAVATAAELAKARADQETQIYELTHSAAENLARQRQLELAAMDESLQPMQRLIYALRDQAQVTEARANQETQLYELTHTAAENLTRQRRLELAAMSESLRPMQQLIYALQDQTKAAEESSKGVEDARGILQKAYDRESTALKSLIDLKTAEAAATRKQIDALKLGALSTLSPELKLEEARRQFDAANGADKNAASSTYLEALRAFYGTSGQYVDGYKYVQQQLDAQARAASTEASNAQQQLNLLNASVNGLLQVDASVISVRDAIEGLKLAMQNAAAAAKPQAGSADVLENLYKVLLGRKSDAAGYDYWKEQLNAGASIADVIAGFQNSSEYIKLNGSHANGLANVPFNGYIAELHEDEAVLTAGQNAIWKAMNKPASAAANRKPPALPEAEAATQASLRQSLAIERQNELLEMLVKKIEDGNTDVQEGNRKNMRELKQTLVHVISKVAA